MPTIDEIIAKLDLQPHPEGGFFKEMWRSDEILKRTNGDIRSVGTSIYFLLPKGVISAWHKVESVEIWHFYSGDPLILELEDDAGKLIKIEMHSDVLNGGNPQALVKHGQWQRAYSTGEYSLVGCTVSPGFDFEDFTMR